MIRNSEAGYAVDAESGIYHARYAEHAAQLPKTRTKKGVEAFGSGFRPCRECFPTNRPAAAAASRPPRKRRRGRTLVVGP